MYALLDHIPTEDSDITSEMRSFERSDIFLNEVEPDTRRTAAVVVERHGPISPSVVLWSAKSCPLVASPASSAHWQVYLFLMN